MQHETGTQETFPPSPAKTNKPTTPIYANSQPKLPKEKGRRREPCNCPRTQPRALQTCMLIQTRKRKVFLPCYYGRDLVLLHELHYMQTYITSRLKNACLSVYSSMKMQLDGKGRGSTFVFPNGHRTQKNRLPSKEARSGISPSWLCMCFATLIFSGLGKGTAWHLPSPLSIA